MTEDEARREIAELLAAAEGHEAQARKCRRAVGLVLGLMRSGRSTAEFHAFLKAAGIDQRSAVLYVEMASGGTVLHG